MSVDITPSVEAPMKAHYAEVRARLSVSQPGAKVRQRPSVRRVVLSPPPPSTLPVATPAKPKPQPQWVWENEVDRALYHNSPKRIIGEICVKHNVTLRELMGKSRQREFIVARRELCWRMRNETLVSDRQISLKEIGMRLGLDHTTVLHHVRKYDGMLAAEGGQG